ncbi:MAG: Lrp/AsnC family transcriptional regulator [Promethearchaeati archaeon SRVP18_Atabeyarchaeia-1]
MSEISEKDLEILRILQDNCRLRAKEISKRIQTPISTVFAKTKRMEKDGIIKGYKAILDPGKLGKGATAFVLITFEHVVGVGEAGPSQRDVAREIAKLKEVQEVHIITGDWDLLAKVKARDMDDIGRLLIDRIRLIRGVKKTLTCVAFQTEKETTDVI